MSIDIDAIIKHMKENPLTPEEYERDILCLNGRMTSELFDKVMNELSSRGSLNDENISYNEDKYNITRQDFSDVFHYLDAIAGDNKYEVDCSFPNTQASFEYEGKKFIWDLVIGQGSSCSLYVYGFNDEAFLDDKKIVIKEINQDIKFFKRLK